MNIKQNNYLTLVLICLGYFIDFYDLSVMGASYSELIKEQFNIIDVTQIQQTYLLISNFQTAGIFIGAVLFGMLGDKIGRASAIRYSILLYTIATILAVYTHSLSFFIFLRMLAYIGLASEFATSTVLILELFPVKSAAWGSAALYSFGVLGGITSTVVGFFSWKVMFWIGGSAGLLLYLARGSIKESAEYLYVRQQKAQKSLGSFSQLLTSKIHLFNLFKYFLMILPYYTIITMMFIFPNYIAKSTDLGYATKILLIGFFIGNIISSFLSALLNNYFQNYKSFLSIMLVVFLVLMLSFNHISRQWLFIYSIGLGLVGGGYPISWAQQLAKEFPAEIRSLASNCLFALGRASSILFNTIISASLAIGAFKINAYFIVVTVFILALLSLYFSRNTYNVQTISNHQMEVS